MDAIEGLCRTGLYRKKKNYSDKLQDLENDIKRRIEDIKQDIIEYNKLENEDSLNRIEKYEKDLLLYKNILSITLLDREDATINNISKKLKKLKKKNFISRDEFYYYQYRIEMEDQLIDEKDLRAYAKDEDPSRFLCIITHEVDRLKAIENELETILRESDKKELRKNFKFWKKNT